MGGPLEGVTIIELASWMFIPSGGSVLVDWGADVIKVEHPVTGDPQRGLISSGLVPGGAGGVNFMIEQPNRGKKSVGIDLANPDGREDFLDLVEKADVLLTNYLPQVRRKLDIEKAITHKRVYLAIKEAARAVGAEMGYDIIFVNDSLSGIASGTELDVRRQIEARRMLYVNQEIDLTDLIVARMNA